MSTLTLLEQAAPTPPSATQHIFFMKPDGYLYVMDSLGTERQLGYVATSINNFIDFTTAASVRAPRRLRWNDTDGTLEVDLLGTSVTLQIGQEQLIRIRNNTGATLTNGTVVRVTGSIGGDKLTVAKAQADSEANSANTLAVVTEDIANNADGYVTFSGKVRALDTSAFAEGAALWLSSTVAGGMTTVRPAAPAHGVFLGWVLSSHPSTGMIYVSVANGHELSELHDVLITAPATGHVLTYDAVLGVWKNLPNAGGGGAGNFPFYTAAGVYDAIAVSGGLFPFYRADGTLDNIGVV